MVKIRFERSNKKVSDDILPPPPPPPTWERAYGSKRDVILGNKAPTPPPPPPPPPPPVEAQEQPEDEVEEVVEEVKRSPRVTRNTPIPPPPPPIPIEIEYFKEHYSDVFGADSLIGNDIIKLNLSFGIFSELLKIRKLLEEE